MARQLTLEERERISQMHYADFTNAEIAEELWVIVVVALAAWEWKEHLAKGRAERGAARYWNMVQSFRKPS